MGLNLSRFCRLQAFSAFQTKLHLYAGKSEGKVRLWAKSITQHQSYVPSYHYQRDLLLRGESSVKQEAFLVRTSKVQVLPSWHSY